MGTDNMPVLDIVCQQNLLLSGPLRFPLLCLHDDTCISSLKNSLSLYFACLLIEQTCVLYMSVTLWVLDA